VTRRTAVRAEGVDNTAGAGKMPVAATREAPDEELRQERLDFARSLGLKAPVSLAVLQAAMQDESYAHNLRVSSRTPALLKMLLAKPPDVRAAGVRFTNAQLAGKALEAVGRWAKSGFSVVDAATLQRRREACDACPRRSPAPDQLAYKLTPGAGDVCAMCGCRIDAKIRLPSESCPDRHPTREGLTRWGEAIKRSSA
jgi:hypothetical protein